MGGLRLPAAELVAAARSASGEVTARSAREGLCRSLYGSNLRELLWRDDRAAYARSVGMDIADARVMITIETRDGVEETETRALVAEHDVQQALFGRMYSRVAYLVEGRVPIERLCALSNDARVLRVDRPAIVISSAADG